MGYISHAFENIKGESPEISIQNNEEERLCI